MAVSHKSPVSSGPRMNERSLVSSRPSPGEHATAEGSRPSVWLFAIPVLCCGGPAIVTALAAAGVVTLGVVGGVAGGVLLVVAIGLLRRHRRRATCCTAKRPIGGHEHD